jgi:2-polyprenyl-3-methyl-5-hydroxy-6-metoxy-1,4-benzoquinol methylase
MKTAILKRKKLQKNLSKSKTLIDAQYGYRILNPKPSISEINQFYGKNYYQLIRKGKRAPEIRRMLKGGKEARRERSWLETTLFSDLEFLLKEHLIKGKVLDVGCGTGDLVKYLSKEGFKAEGLEPSKDAVAYGRSQGILIHHANLESYHSSNRKEEFGAVFLMNVLEHVLNPIKTVEWAGDLLKKGGLLIVRVPNDFSEFQLAAKNHLKKKEWWVVAPDHINYFNFASLNSVFTRNGFEVVYSQGDFPMEMFLLMGDDYLKDPKVGNDCHQRRISFELGLPAELRRKIYQSNASIGMGRTCLIAGVKK